MAKKEIEGWGEETPDLSTMSFNDMMEAGVIDIAEIDDTTIVEQADLVGKPFILFDWDIKVSETFGGFYAVCKVKTADGTAVFSDGGQGIVEALERYEKRRQELDTKSPLYFHYGLRASSYMKQLPDADGEMRSIPATTYYFDNRRRP